jgi:HK97 family phage major capsid protein
MSAAADPKPVSVSDLVSPSQLARSGCVHRSLILSKGSVDKEARTVELSFSSETPVLRSTWDNRLFWEVLDHSTVDTSRMSRAPLLYNHDRSEHLGTTLAFSFGSDLRGRARVKFSRSAFAQEKFQDVEDEILTDTSVGYDLSNAEPVADGEREGIPVYRFRKWQPYEITLTTLGADPSVGFGRSVPPESPAAPVAASTQPVRLLPSMSATVETPAAPAAKPVDHLSRQKEIRESAKVLLARHPQHTEAIRSLAEKCMFDTGDDVGAFQRCVLTDILGTKQEFAPVRQDPQASRVGLNKRDLKRYSILSAVRALAEGRAVEGLEKECHDELTKKLGRQARGFFLPEEIAADRRAARRTLLAGSPVDGGYTVSEDLLASEFVEFLRNNSVVVKAGARMISGLVGDVSIPRQITGATAYWSAEGVALTQSSATFGQIISRPRRIGTSVPYSKQFIAQTSLDAESFVIADSDASIATELDRVALRGTGGAEPLGIANLATGDRSTSVTFGAAPTWAKYLEFFSSVAANNAVTGSPAYVAAVASAVKAMATAKFTNTGVPIWDNDRVGVFPAHWTTQLLTTATPVANMVIFGDFAQVLFMEWAGRDVVVDPYTYKKEGNVEITIQRLVDCVIRRGKSFAISTDSGAQ